MNYAAHMILLGTAILLGIGFGYTSGQSEVSALKAENSALLEGLVDSEARHDALLQALRGYQALIASYGEGVPMDCSGEAVDVDGQQVTINAPILVNGGTFAVRGEVHGGMVIQYAYAINAGMAIELDQPEPVSISACDPGFDPPPGSLYVTGDCLSGAGAP